MVFGKRIWPFGRRGAEPSSVRGPDTKAVMLPELFPPSMMAARILLSGPARIDANYLQSAVNRRFQNPFFPAVIPEARVDKGEIALQVGWTRMLIQELPHPMLDETLQQAEMQALLWPNRSDALAQYQRSLFIFGGTELALAAPGAEPRTAVLFTAMAITLVAATIIETCPGALGLLWQNGGALVPPDIVMRVARTCADDQVDPLVWVRVNIANLEDKLFGAHTSGLASFCGLEIEHVMGRHSVRDVQVRTYVAARHVILFGPPDAEPVTLDLGEGEKVCLTRVERHPRTGAPMIFLADAVSAS